MVDQSTVPSSAIHNSCHPTSELLSGPSTLKSMYNMLIYFTACIIFVIFCRLMQRGGASNAMAVKQRIVVNAAIA